MLKINLLVLCACCFASGCAQKPILFPVSIDNKTGYVDSAGRMVIPAQFFNGGVFVDGLAAVRKDGLYGYIDGSGHFVIQPVYDFASDFCQGMAVVYKDGAPAFIDRYEKPVLPRWVNNCQLIENGLAIIQTASGRLALMDIPHARQLTDTLYSRIGEFNNGLAVAELFVNSASQSKSRQVVIDNAGNTLIAAGIYNAIQPFSENFAVVLKGGYDNGKYGIIDKNGKPVFLKTFNRSCSPGDVFRNGLAKMNLYKYWIPEEKGVISSSTKDYEGYINLKGDIVLDDTTVEYARPFSCGRAFIKHIDSEYILINTSFERVGTDSYYKVRDDVFRDRLAIVQKEGQWGIIDTTGLFIVPAAYNEINAIMGNYFVYSNPGKDGSMLYGISTLQNKVVVHPEMQAFDSRGFVNGLLNAVMDNRQVYINPAGKIVWSGAQEKKGQLARLNIDYMNRGYCYAYSTPNHGKQDSGGWAISSNYPIRVEANKSFEQNKLSLVIDTAAVDSFQHRYYGYKMYLVNTTGKSVEFSAQDSRLSMKMQALDKNNQWRDVEYLPSSWCGNSYHTLKLEPGAYWSFGVPRYDGQFPVALRMQLVVNDRGNAKKQLLLHSNIIYGSVNPAQFWRKPGYQPNGIMDPYFD